MGDINQRIFLETLLPKASGPVIEIGSKDYGNTTSFRDLYHSVEYVGVDVEAGAGVDVVADLSLGLGCLKESYFAVGIYCSVLEHTPRPWIMAGNIGRLLRAKGVLYISVPWVWRYHTYPDETTSASRRVRSRLSSQSLDGARRPTRQMSLVRSSSSICAISGR